MNKSTDGDSALSTEDELDIAALKIEGLTAALHALTASLKASGAIDLRVLEEKISKATSDTSVPDEWRAHFEHPMRQIQYTLSDQTAEDELRIFGDLRIHAPQPAKS